MTQDEIIAMAREAGAIRRYWGDNKEGFAFESDEQLERFAALVAEEKDKEIDRLENALVYLCVMCRSDYKDLPNQKSVINTVHDYCAEVLEGTE